MKNSYQWWEEVKQDNKLLVDWLKDQYHGEVMAAVRIKDVFGNFILSKTQKQVVDKISREEARHAAWIGKLLKSRGIVPSVLTKKERYWDKTLVDIESVEDAAAIGHHAEAMRLERIRTICQDESAPEDIRQVFMKILPEEEGHEALFKGLSDAEHIQKRSGNHMAGTAALGLVL